MDAETAPKHDVFGQSMLSRVLKTVDAARLSGYISLFFSPVVLGNTKNSFSLGYMYCVLSNLSLFTCCSCMLFSSPQKQGIAMSANDVYWGFRSEIEDTFSVDRKARNQPLSRGSF